VSHYTRPVRGLYPGCDQLESNLKRAADFLVETRRGVVNHPKDAEWLTVYRKADDEMRKACTAFLETQPPKAP
jgi:hypothetical protein